VNNTFTVNLGKSPSVYEVAPREGLRFEYNSGNQFPWGGRACASALNIVCEPDVNATEPELSSNSSIADLNQKCLVEFTMYSKYACPVCRSVDVAYVEGECINGRKTRSYYSITKCLGSENLEKEVIVECSPEVVVKSQTVILSLILAFIILGGTIAAVVFLVVKNRRLHHDYMVLSQTTVPLDDRRSAEEDNFPPNKQQDNVSPSSSFVIEDQPVKLEQ